MYFAQMIHENSLKLCIRRFRSGRIHFAQMISSYFREINPNEKRRFSLLAVPTLT